MGYVIGVASIRLRIITQTPSHTYHTYETHAFDTRARARELLCKLEGFPEVMVYLILRIVVVGCYRGVFTIRMSIMTQITSHTYHTYETHGFDARARSQARDRCVRDRYGLPLPLLAPSGRLKTLSRNFFETTPQIMLIF